MKLIIIFLLICNTCIGQRIDSFEIVYKITNSGTEIIDKHAPATYQLADSMWSNYDTTWIVYRYTPIWKILDSFFNKVNDSTWKIPHKKTHKKKKGRKIIIQADSSVKPVSAGMDITSLMQGTYVFRLNPRPLPSFPYEYDGMALPLAILIVLVFILFVGGTVGVIDWVSKYFNKKKK